MKLTVAIVAALLAAVVVAASAAADGPVASRTVTTTCSFDPRDSVEHGVTTCNQTIDIVQPGSCWGAVSGFRLWEEDVIASARTYRGNVVSAGQNGVAVSGDYGSLVRAHAKLLDDSGDHAFSSTFPVEDSSCP
jgi:hypothetical protein